MTAGQFTTVFLIVLSLRIVLQFWLALRQIQHVRAHRQAVPAAFAESIPLDAHQRAADYTIAKMRFSLLENAFETLVLLAFTLGGGIDWLVRLAQTYWSSPLVVGLALFAAYGFITSIIGLPLSIYSTFGLEARFGFNRTTVRLFILDMFKGTLLAVIIGTPLLAAILWLMGQMGSLWWFWVWLTWASFSLLMMWIFPSFIAPLFNKFTPLADKELKGRIETLLQQCGFRSSGIFVMDGSKRSNHGNAYFTGLGGAKRVVFFDTLLTQLNTDEVLAVLAHELGHFHHRHILQRLVWTLGLALILLWALGQLMGQSWFYLGTGISNILANHAAASQLPALGLLLFFLILPVFSFVFGPIASWLSRRNEYQADAYAAKKAQASDLISGLVKLFRDNASTLTPDPVYSIFYYSHPPATLRIAALQALN